MPQQPSSIPTTHNPGAEYDAMADAYNAHVDTQPHNALYERPAVLSLLPPLAGLTVLDAGCGSGWYAQHYLEHEVKRVVCVDASEKMTAAARARLGERAQVLVADLGQSLNFATNGEYDLVVAPLVLHYLLDWLPTLREFHRVLKPNGLFVFSTHHPIMDFKLFNLPDYFATALIEDEWSTGKVTYYHHSLSAICATLAEAGFSIERLLEPQPVPAMQASHPELYDRLMHNPWFLVIRARRI
ncbi:MAG: class I SAM-dependent methyltransferase [Chloroflexi bacterium]|nr:MAG: class I SAM-dependent methyltransferase [Chloroflexota bacterium]